MYEDYYGCLVASSGEVFRSQQTETRRHGDIQEEYEEDTSPETDFTS